MTCIILAAKYWYEFHYIEHIQARWANRVEEENTRKISKKKLRINYCQYLVYACIATSRLRLGSHSLRVETGRWSRTPRENRLCICGNVQDEIHVLLHCPLTHHLRHEFPSLTFQSIDELMTGDPSAVTTFCRKVLETYVWNNPLYSIARPFHL